MTGISHDGQESVLISAGVAGTDDEEEVPLVDFQLEVNPLEREDMDVLVRTYVRPLRITYDEVCLHMYIVAQGVKCTCVIAHYVCT